MTYIQAYPLAHLVQEVKVHEVEEVDDDWIIY
jgi:hypothetical protein